MIPNIEEKEGGNYFLVVIASSPPLSAKGGMVRQGLKRGNLGYSLLNRGIDIFITPALTPVLLESFVANHLTALICLLFVCETGKYLAMIVIKFHLNS